MGTSVFRSLMAAACLAAATPLLAQQSGPDIVEIMHQFILAEHAAKQCLKPDQATWARFEANRRIVVLRSTEEMLRRKPDASAWQVSQWFARSTAPAMMQMDEIIRSKGCTDPRIQDLLKRFELQVNWKLGEAAQGGRKQNR